MTADGSDVCGMDEVEAGIGSQEPCQPKPFARFRQAFGEVARREATGAVDATAKHQRWKHSNDLLCERMFFQILEALGLGLDVLRAVGQGFLQRLKMPVKNARG